MNAEEYLEKTEKQLIEGFLDSFYKKMGYYPTVVTKEDLEDRSLNLLSLEELETYFEPYLPILRGKILKLSTKMRVREIVELRQMFCFIARSIGFSLKTIGIFLGNRDHTTIVHNVKAFHNMMDTDSTYRDRYIIIAKKIKQDGNYYNSSAMVGSNKIQDKS